MSYSASIDRTEAGPLIPEDASHEIIDATTERPRLPHPIPKRCARSPA